jgi:hypothetical protein
LFLIYMFMVTLAAFIIVAQHPLAADHID